MSKIEVLKGWITQQSGFDEVGLETDLVDEKVLNSIQMINFLLFIEETLGHEIPEKLIKVENFKTLKRIQELLFQTSANT